MQFGGTSASATLFKAGGCSETSHIIFIDTDEAVRCFLRSVLKCRQFVVPIELRNSLK
jgi:hypothetical protein